MYAAICYGSTNVQGMKSILHKASTRGHVQHGWLNTYHTFSFANYYNPDRTHFGVLRVLNDDIIDGGQGFGEHPHDNMEIITIVLDGALEHQDSMGNIHVLKPGDVQVMSAGTGITHSEYNNQEKQSVRLLQIWIFPEEQNLEPRYDQAFFNSEERVNKWQTIVTPKDKSTLWVNQNAWFYLTNLESESTLTHDVSRNGNGVYLFVISGEIEIGELRLSERDGLGIHEATSFQIKALQKAEILLMDIPMSI